MGITAKMVKKGDALSKRVHRFPITTAVSLADVKVGTITPGFRFQIESVKVFAETVTATISVNVKIGTTSVLTGAITPVAGTDTSGTLVSTVASRRGTSSQAINVHVTTNGTGAARNITVEVTLRAFPSNGDAE
jgi:hypothetical protein